MNILVISQHSNVGIGGPERYLENLLSHLGRMKNRIYLMVDGGVSPDLESVIKDTNSNMLLLPAWSHVQNQIRLMPKPLKYIAEALALQVAILRLKPPVDLVVVSHCSPGRFLLPWGPLGNAVLIFHSEPVGRKHIMAGPVFRFLVGRNAKLVAVSKYVASEILRNWAFGSRAGRHRLSKKLITVRNPSFQASLAPYYVPENRHEVLMVGGANWYKNPWLWLKVAELVIRRGGGKGINFRWIGDGPLLAEMRAHVAERGLERRIFLPGHVEDVRPAYAAARLYMQLSVRESMGIAAVDALGAGLPMVVNNVGGLPETVTHGTNGLIFDSASANRIADTLGPLLRDLVLLQKFSEASYAKFEKDFSVETWLKGMQRVLPL